MNTPFIQKIIAGLLLLTTLSPLVVLAQVGASASGGGVLSKSINHGYRISAAIADVSASAVASAAPGIPSLDAGVRAQNVSKAGKGLADAIVGVLEDVLDALEKVLFATLKKKILDMMVDQIVVYIQGGGQPKFVTDWQGFFADAAQGAVGEFAKEIGAGFLCEPFSLQLKLNLGLLPVERFGDGSPFSCTLDKIVGNIQDFYSDFRNGGWNAFDVSFEPQNNYFGSFMIAWNEKYERIAEATIAAEKEAESGGGFLSSRRCVTEAGVELKGDEVERWREAVRNDKTGRRSITCNIVTPGDTLGKTVAKAVGTDIDFLLSSDELSHYIAAIADALINRVIKEGVGLAGVSAPSAPARVRGREPGALYEQSQLPAGIKNAQRKLDATQGTIEERLVPLNNPRKDALVAMKARLQLEQSLINPLENLLACESQRFRRLSTQQELDSQRQTIASLNDQITQTQKLVDAFDATAKTANDSDSVAIATSQNVTDAFTLKNQAEADLQRAQVLVKNQLSSVDARSLQCKQGIFDFDF